MILGDLALEMVIFTSFAFTLSYFRAEAPASALKYERVKVVKTKALVTKIIHKTIISVKN